MYIKIQNIGQQILYKSKLISQMNGQTSQDINWQHKWLQKRASVLQNQNKTITKYREILLSKIQALVYMNKQLKAQLITHYQSIQHIDLQQITKLQGKLKHASELLDRQNMQVQHMQTQNKKLQFQLQSIKQNIQHPQLQPIQVSKQYNKTTQQDYIKQLKQKYEEQIEQKDKQINNLINILNSQNKQLNLIDNQVKTNMQIRQIRLANKNLQSKIQLILRTNQDIRNKIHQLQVQLIRQNTNVKASNMIEYQSHMLQLQAQQQQVKVQQQSQMMRKLKQRSISLASKIKAIAHRISARYQKQPSSPTSNILQKYHGQQKVLNSQVPQKINNLSNVNVAQAQRNTKNIGDNYNFQGKLINTQRQLQLKNQKQLLKIAQQKNKKSLYTIQKLTHQNVQIKNKIQITRERTIKIKTQQQEQSFSNSHAILTNFQQLKSQLEELKYKMINLQQIQNRFEYQDQGDYVVKNKGIGILRSFTFNQEQNKQQENVSQNLQVQDNSNSSLGSIYKQKNRKQSIQEIKQKLSKLRDTNKKYLNQQNNDNKFQIRKQPSNIFQKAPKQRQLQTIQQKLQRLKKNNLKLKQENY